MHLRVVNLYLLYLLNVNLYLCFLFNTKVLRIWQELGHQVNEFQSCFPRNCNWFLSLFFFINFQLCCSVTHTTNEICVSLASFQVLMFMLPIHDFLQHIPAKITPWRKNKSVSHKIYIKLFYHLTVYYCQMLCVLFLYCWWFTGV